MKYILYLGKLYSDESQILKGDTNEYLLMPPSTISISTMVQD